MGVVQALMSPSQPPDTADAPAQARTVAIVQSNYIPWKGYFDLINRADAFILLDDVQYTRRDWRNRNRIKTPQGVQWLTIPVEVKGKYHQRICDTQVSDPAWGAAHWATLRHHYGQAPHFAEYGSQVEALYAVDGERSLSRINFRFLTAICGLLGITTPILWSMDYDTPAEPTARLLSLCRAAGATRYLSGPAAQAYLDEAPFAAAGIAVDYMAYDGYPEYPQRHGPFDHHVTVLDLLFNAGPEAPRYMKTF